MAKKVAEKDKRVPHGFMIEPWQFKALRKLAFAREETMSVLVREALEDYIKKEKNQTKRIK